MEQIGPGKGAAIDGMDVCDRVYLRPQTKTGVNIRNDFRDDRGTARILRRCRYIHAGQEADKREQG